MKTKRKIKATDTVFGKVLVKQGTYVSRAAYTKLQMKYQALMADVKTICWEKDIEVRSKVLHRWRKHFAENDMLNTVLKEYAQDYFKKNPKLKIGSPEYDRKAFNRFIKKGK